MLFKPKLYTDQREEIRTQHTNFQLKKIEKNQKEEEGSSDTCPISKLHTTIFKPSSSFK
jgi:hypothetical protein